MPNAPFVLKGGFPLTVECHTALHSGLAGPFLDQPRAGRHPPPFGAVFTGTVTPALLLCPCIPAPLSWRHRNFDQAGTGSGLAGALTPTPMPPSPYTLPC